MSQARSGNPYLQFPKITARGGYHSRAEVLSVHRCQLTLAKGSGRGTFPFPRLKWRVWRAVTAARFPQRPCLCVDIGTVQTKLSPNGLKEELY